MKLKLFIFALLAILVTSCNREPIPEPVENEGKIVTITATIAPETRVTYTDGTGTNPSTLGWEEGDELKLAGYDANNAYIGFSTFSWTGEGDKFTGTPVQGATKYKAYYPASVQIGAGGTAALPVNFWQQTQMGDNNAAHLGPKLFMSDNEPKVLGQTFILVAKSSVIRFNLSNIPSDVGNLQQLIWKVETSTGVFKSMTLNVNGVTFSAAKSDMTAFLSFDPTEMKIAANGKVKISLLGEQSYVWSVSVGSGKDYTAGLRYRGSASSWTLNQPPLIYVTEYNVKGDDQTGYSFVKDLTACEGSGYYDWYTAVDKFNSISIDHAFCHLPTNKELCGIVPKYGTADINYIRFNSAAFGPYYDVSENVVVQGEEIYMTSDFHNTGNNISYALRYKGTDMVSAWRYQFVPDPNKKHTHMKITARYVSPSVTINDITNETFWNNSANDVVRYFPACGSHEPSSASNPYPNLGTYGHYWSSSDCSVTNACFMIFSSANAMSCTGKPKTQLITVRLFN